MYGHGGHLGPVTNLFEQTYVPTFHKSTVWNFTLTGPVVSEEKMLKERGRRRRTNDRGLPIF